MLDVLGITTPIFIIIGLGYLAARIRLLTREQIRGLGTFVITFALPALVIDSLAQRPIREVLNPHYLASYGVASLGCFALGLLLFRRVHKADMSNASIAAMGMSISNSALIGYPIAAMAVGPMAVVVLALGMLVENLLMVPLGLALAEAARQEGGSMRRAIGQTLTRLARNPLIIAILIGGLLSLSQVSIPAAPLKVIEMLSHASAPVALFVIGGALYGTPVRGQLNEILQIGTGKLFLHPALLGLAMWLFGDLPPAMMVAGLILASSPMMSIYPIIGQRFGLEGRCAAALVITTLASFFTISLLLMIARA